MDWSEFDNAVDLDELKDNIKDAEQNKREFVELPLGNYIVTIDKLELTQSKKGSPMVSCWMKVVDGQYKGQRLFYNQVVSSAFGIHMNNEFVRSLDSGVDIEFNSYVQYGGLLMDVLEAIDGRLEYEIEYGKNDKDYSTFVVKNVFEIE